MYIVDFEYANKRLSEFNCIPCHIDESFGLEEIDIGCDITFDTVKNNHSSIYSITSSNYENLYTTSFDIAKNPCSLNDDDIYFTVLEIRELTRWLNRREYFKFKPFDLDNEADIHFYGSFNVKPLTFGSKMVGLRVEFTANAPYAFAEPILTKHIMTTPDSELYLYGDSDEITTLLPTIQIRCFKDGKLKITNQLTENYVHIKNCVNGETITIDGEHKIIFTDNEAHAETLYEDFNYSYFDILVDEYNTQNSYKVSLPCEISVSYSPIRKVGVY